MEVQGRPALAPRRLSGLAAAAWARRWLVLGIATVVTCAAVAVDAQPVRSPWWTYADADASYSASALNLLLGERVRFVDHPGLPITEATTLAFAVDALLEEGSLSSSARRHYVDTRLLDLDSARGVFRGVAIAIYLAGALLAFVLFGRLLGHWTWGLAAGILWLAAPGLIAMSIQLRPDVALAVVTIGFAYAVGRAVATRDPLPYAVAGLLVGFAVMVKLHALGLVVPLAVAGGWSPPEGGWRELARRARPRLVAAVAVPWAVVAVCLNVARAPFTPTSEQVVTLLALLAAVGAAVAVGLVVSRLRALVVVTPAIALGLLLPVTLDVPDGLQALLTVAKTATGQGVQEGVESFATPISQLWALVGPRVMVVFLIAAAAGLVGVIVRDPQPVVWAAGAGMMIVLAFARPPNLHYFASAFVLSVPAALWLLRRERRGPAPLLVWPVVILLAWPAFRDREAPTVEAEQFAAVVQPTKRVVDERLARNEFALVPSYWPFADSRYFELVQLYVDYSPAYPYKYLPATAAARPFAEARGWQPRYFISPVALGVEGDKAVEVGEYGRYLARRLAGTELGLELLGPAP